MFGKYVDPRIVDALLLTSDAINISEGKKKNMTIFFSDIENFTAIAESLTPHGLVALMNKYFSLLSKPISDHKGVIDKYTGDSIMAFWGDPFTGEEEQAKLNESLAGSVGSSNSQPYTVMGDTVNVASRLESINKQFGTRILISESTFEMVKEDFVTRKIDNIIVMGKPSQCLYTNSSVKKKQWNIKR